MAAVKKKVIKYNLELSEAEYYAIICLVGNVSYPNFKDCVNQRYSIRFGREEQEDFEVLSSEDYTSLYNNLEDNK